LRINFLRDLALFGSFERLAKFGFRAGYSPAAGVKLVTTRAIKKLIAEAIRPT
jgi:hypothetical protein